MELCGEMVFSVEIWLPSTPRKLKGMSYEFADALCSREHGGLVWGMERVG